MLIKDASVTDIDQVMKAAAAAFVLYKAISAEKKALFLEAIAFEMELKGDELIAQASAETNLPAARLQGERNRTTMQLRSFAAMLREGSWQELSIDTAIPERQPLPKRDIRKMLVPLGPVVVFGASNFPFAYSTAGGDTASALAAGCSVVVKAHPAHAKTSAMVAETIQRAAASTGMPQHVFQHVFGATPASGRALVQHPDTAAVGFTGSFSGGTALYSYAQERKIPIPVFSEMGSVNPVLLLPDALVTDALSIAQLYTPSITNGMGQFCTKPGILIGVKDAGLELFVKELAKQIALIEPAQMLHTGIQKAYNEKLQAALSEAGVELIQQSNSDPQGGAGWPTIATVSGEDFIRNEKLQEEVFGPFALIVKCADTDELLTAWQLLQGQISTSIMGTAQDFTSLPTILKLAETIAGRIVLNDIPTGVEVCPSMVHGGPYPASTDSRFSAVGITAVKRWVRPVCYQNFPDQLLPDALKNANSSNAWRLVNNHYTNKAI